MGDRPTSECALPSAIEREKVVVAEGKETCILLERFLAFLGAADSIQVRDFGGVSELRSYLGLLRKIDGFQQLQSLGVVRDAETDAAAAFQSVCGALSSAGLPSPAGPGLLVGGSPRVGVFILPDGASPGMIETLCLAAVREDPAAHCVDEYLDCLRRSGIEGPRNVEKARVQAFLASRPEACAHLGLGAKKGYWPWEGSAFGPLGSFLTSL
jgi:hypothetical protein